MATIFITSTGTGYIYLNTTPLKMAVLLQSQSSTNNIDPDAPTLHVPGKPYDCDSAHCTIGLQASKDTQAVHDMRLFPALPNSSSRTANIDKCRCNHRNTDQITYGTSPMVDLATTNHKWSTNITCPVHTNNAMVYITGLSVAEAQILTPHPPVVHDHVTQTHQKQIPPTAGTPPAFIPPSRQLTEPLPHEGEEGLPASLNPQNGFPDPWSSELAHTFPWSVRRAALVDTLHALEASLNITTSK